MTGRIVKNKRYCTEKGTRLDDGLRRYKFNTCKGYSSSKLHTKPAIKVLEEVNRILTGRVSDILFFLTDIAVDNLVKEGYESLDYRIVNSDDVMQNFYKNFAVNLK